MVDLSSWPVVRLDELPSLTVAQLRELVVDVNQLLSETPPSDGLGRYLRQQLDKTNVELASREAAARVAALLSGSEEIVSAEVQQQRYESIIGFTNATQTPAAPSQQSVVTYEKVDSKLGASQKHVPHLHFSESDSTPNRSSSLTDRSDLTSGTQSTGPPPMAVAAARRTLASLSRPLEYAFVVEATEPRRRHVAKKVAGPTREERLESERNERRKAAIERLVNRRNKRDSQKHQSDNERSLARARRQQRRAKTIAAAAATAAAAAAMEAQKLSRKPNLPSRRSTTPNGQNELTTSEERSQKKYLPSAEINTKVGLTKEEILEAEAEAEKRGLDAGDSSDSEDVSGGEEDKTPLVSWKDVQLLNAALAAECSTIEVDSPVDNAHSTILHTVASNVVESASEDVLPTPSPSKTSKSVSHVDLKNSSTSSWLQDPLLPPAIPGLPLDSQSKNLAALASVRKMRDRLHQRRLQETGQQSSTESAVNSEEVVGSYETSNYDKKSPKDISKDVPSLPIPVSSSENYANLESSSYAILPPTTQLVHLVDGRYIVHIGADDLPGLAAWVLLNGVWHFNEEAFSHSPRIDQSNGPLFECRKDMHKKISGMLIWLTESLAPILFGDASDRVVIRTESDSIKHWEEHLLTISSVLTSSPPSFLDYLLEEVDVCGNTHNLCRRIEALVKCRFALSKIVDFLPRLSPRPSRPTSAHLTITPRTTSLLVGSDNQQVMNGVGSGTGISRPTSAHLTITPRTTSLLVGSDNQQVMNGVGSGTGISRPTSAHLTITPRTTSLLVGSDNQQVMNGVGSGTGISRPTSAHPDNEKQSMYSEAFNQIPNEDGDGAEDGSDVELSPRGSSLSIPRETSLSLKPNSSKGSRRGQPLASKTTITSSQMSDMDPSSRPSTVALRPKEIRLTDFFPTFASLFPFVQRTSRSADDPTYARQLLESMTAQAALYEEWVDVMHDYSTVFCFPGEDEPTSRVSSELVYKGGPAALHYRVNGSSRQEVEHIVSDVFSKRLPHWVPLPSGLGLGLSWNFLWTWSKPRINTAHLLIWQRVNHFRDARQLTSKDLLKRNLQRFTDLGGKSAAEFEILPLTFILPHEYTAFVAAFTVAAQKPETVDDPSANFWILKPIGLSRGRGIHLVTDLRELTYSSASVIQQYVSRPMTLNGFKFDLRLYVAVTSFHPLEAFIFTDGFARVSTQSYSRRSEDAANKFIHLTNSSIQRHQKEALDADNPLRDDSGTKAEVGGSKISLLGTHGLWSLLEKQGVDTAALWDSIQLLVVKSLVAVDDRIPNQPCSFEFFGYDVLIDEDLRPWLIEVNASPSLSRENALDYRVKDAAIHDLIELLDLAPYDRLALAKVLRRRLSSIAKNICAAGRGDPDLEADLRRILGSSYIPRRYGEMPAKLGGYQRIAPHTPHYETVLKLKRRIVKPLPGKTI